MGSEFVAVAKTAVHRLTTEALTAIRDRFFSQFDPETCGAIDTDLDFNY